ncbi:hypothetical protein FNO01nite_28830 [Flavobacterium noncentrifugens]|uniref:histidine kinase n=1 Tax=Flavobacterium noncentrifugens TaxID=1128970 RepID=A0A1G8XYD9_9FLAO|nr:PAS domain-containing protein [Flavobacterium noncentrifugens]GEP52211.1 hypothetical protein FNO01nite_28830 [Flavobacterium noncentrifugens]SDJ94790.1 PAS domain S-box-containing protein [Flavobacterium noncentrifugens]
MKSDNDNKDYFFLQNNSECTKLIRNFNWETTPLGSPEKWPVSLRSTLAMMLSSQFPMFVWWGEELIQFYNDAYRQSLGDNGKHPLAIGQRGEDCWPEIWDFVYPKIRKVLDEGESFWYDDLLLPIFRNGKLEDVYWTFSYSPLYGDDGAISGVMVICNETTEKISDKRRLGDDKNELEFAVEAAELGTWDLNPETGAFTANARLKEWFGLKPEETIPLPLATSVIAEKDRERVNSAISKALQSQSGGHYDIEYKIIHPITGNERIVKAKGKALFNDEGIAKRFNGTLQDISEERKNQELFRSIIEQAPVATSLFAGKDMVIEVANDIMLGYWGVDVSAIGKPLAEAIPELIGQPFLQILDDVYTTGITYTDKAAPVRLVLNESPSTYYFDFTYKALKDARGKIYGVMNMSVDVTEQVLLQKHAEEIQRQVLESFEQSPVGIATMDSDNLVYRTANPFYGQLVGRSPEALIGKPMFEAIPEINGQGFDILINDVIATGIPFIAKEVVVSIRRNEQSEKIYVDLTYQPRRNASGKITGILIVAIDVTQQVLSRHVIEDAQLALKSTVDLAKLATWNLDLPSGIFSYSDRFRNWLGLPNEISSIEAFYQILSKKDSENLKHAIASILNPESESLSVFEYEITNQTTGQKRIVSANAQIFYDADGEPEHISGTAQNVTKERKLQEELKFLVKERTLELESVNHNLELSNHELQQFAYVASHDLQEPVRKISVFIEMLEATLNSVDPKAKNYIDKIKSSSGRMSNLIRDVLSLSQLSNVIPVFERVDLGQITNETLTELELVIEQKGATVNVSGLVPIDAIPLQMSQLFGNLISNALKYSRTGIAPEISITGKILSAKEIKFSPGNHSNWLQVEFKDNGIGFDQQYAEKIFNIFQRLHAKQDFAGTGIGLAICRKIVQNHNGFINAQSVENEGAVFTVTLPMHQL